MKFILARHGEDQDNARGVYNGRRNMPLTDLGKQQALALARRIQHANLLPLHAILVSPLQRAQETAQIVAQAFLCNWPCVITIPSLIERNHGIVEGLSYEEAATVADEVRRVQNHTYIIRAQGAETHEELYVRAKQVWQDTRATCGTREISGNVLVVSHSALIRQMIAAYHGLGCEAVFDNILHLENCDYRIIETN